MLEQKYCETCKSVGSIPSGYLIGLERPWNFVTVSGSRCPNRIALSMSTKAEIHGNRH